MIFMGYQNNEIVVVTKFMVLENLKFLSVSVQRSNIAP